ncbi:MAG: Helix-turn-helix domain [Candidatus Eremiobacteraeota bacterium]|nr:Helix-turn-helix domain [Candidatus Eremiobacteraeota bacterium]
MELAFGERGREVRTKLKLSQETVEARTGISQPRLSKIENGKEVASADVIDKLAEAYGVDPVAFVRGTNREAHYIAQRLQPDQREEHARVARLMDATALEYAYLSYTRICDLFDAAYGDGVVPAFRGEERYIDLREFCKKAIAAVEKFRPGFGSLIHFPDHLEPEGDDDDQLMGWEFEHPYLKRSLRAIQEAMNPYNDCYDAESREAMVKHYHLDMVDAEIEQLKAARLKAERLIAKRIEMMSKRHGDDSP